MLGRRAPSGSGTSCIAWSCSVWPYSPLSASSASPGALRLPSAGSHGTPCGALWAVIATVLPNPLSTGCAGTRWHLPGRSGLHQAPQRRRARLTPCLAQRGGLPSGQTRRASDQCCRRDRKGFPQRKQAGGGGAPLPLAVSLQRYQGLHWACYPLVLLPVFLRAGTPDSPPVRVLVCLHVFQSDDLSDVLVPVCPAWRLAVCCSGLFPCCLPYLPVWRALSCRCRPACSGCRLPRACGSPASPASPASSCLRFSRVSQSARATILKHIQPPLAMVRPASCLVLPWLLIRALQQGAS